MTWHPGRAADAHTVVELSFAAEGDATRVRLDPSRLGGARHQAAQAARESYDGGWETVFVRLFGGYIDRAS